MKKAIILLAMIFSFSQMIHSQYWAPKGTTWFYDQDIFPQGSSISYIKFESLGDTVINEDTLTVIQESRSHNDSIHSEFYTKFDDNKVYYFHVQDNNYKLMYDFSAEPGDTLNIYCRQSESDTEPYAYIKIDSLSSLKIGDDTLKVQHFSSIYSVETSCNMIQVQPIIERIGHLKFMFPQHAWADPPYGGNLRCYEDSIIGLYKISDKDCDYFTTDINSEQLNQSNYVYPNPTNNILNIDSKYEITEIKLFNKLGNLILQQQYSDKIDMSALPNDIYFVKIQFKDYYEISKIIKNDL